MRVPFHPVIMHGLPLHLLPPLDPLQAFYSLASAAPSSRRQHRRQVSLVTPLQLVSDLGLYNCSCMFCCAKCCWLAWH
jgi:hypothetical protein